MQQRRKHPRVEVNLPISCRLTDPHGQKTTRHGTIHNLSLCGMKIRLPVQLPHAECLLEYTLALPRPYRAIAGEGKIRWAFWDEKTQCTDFGLELAPLNGQQHCEFETLLLELAEKPNWDE